MVGRCIQRTTTHRVRSCGRCISVVQGWWMRSTGLHGGDSSSYDGTIARIWSVRSRRSTDFPDQDAERSLWMGETGIRLVLQRLAPSQANLERLSELIAANERDERCELMWGSPGTILAGREIGPDLAASNEWLHRRRDTEGLWTQQLYGQSRRFLGPAHGFAGCVLRPRRCLRRLGDVSSALPSRRMGSSTGRHSRGCDLTQTATGKIRTQWCHGAPGIIATLAHILDEELAVAGGELAWCAGPLRRAQTSATVQRGTDTHSWRCLSARETNGGSSERAHLRCTLQVRWSTAGRTTGAAATRSGRATSAQPSTSLTAPTVEGSYPSRSGPSS